MARRVWPTAFTIDQDQCEDKSSREGTTTGSGTPEPVLATPCPHFKVWNVGLLSQSNIVDVCHPGFPFRLRYFLIVSSRVRATRTSAIQVFPFRLRYFLIVSSRARATKGIIETYSTLSGKSSGQETSRKLWSTWALCNPSGCAHGADMQNMPHRP